jgi:hypothetical protein
VHKVENEQGLQVGRSRTKLPTSLVWEESYIFVCKSLLIIHFGLFSIIGGFCVCLQKTLSLVVTLVSEHL